MTIIRNRDDLQAYIAGLEARHASPMVGIEKCPPAYPFMVTAMHGHDYYEGGAGVWHVTFFTQAHAEQLTSVGPLAPNPAAQPIPFGILPEGSYIRGPSGPGITGIRPVVRSRNAVLLDLRLLPESERLDLFHEFCVHCGREDPACNCMRDE